MSQTSELDDLSVARDELKGVQEDRRFVVTRYMQAIAFYLALVAFVGGQYFQATREAKLFFLLLMFVANTLAWLAARQFRDLAYHALNREIELSDKLKVQPPYPLIWGYRYALVLGGIVQTAVIFGLVRLYITI